MAMGILHTIDTILTVVEDHKEVRLSQLRMKSFFPTFESSQHAFLYMKLLHLK